VTELVGQPHANRPAVAHGKIIAIYLLAEKNARIGKSDAWFKGRFSEPIYQQQQRFSTKPIA